MNNDVQIIIACFVNRWSFMYSEVRVEFKQYCTVYACFQM